LTMGHGWRWLLVVMAAVVVLAGAGWVGLGVATSRSQLARAVRWGESDTGDHRRFPARPVRAGPERSPLRRPADGGRVPPPQVRRVEVREGERRVERDLAQFLAASDTTGQGRIGSVNDPITRYGPSWPNATGALPRSPCGSC
jgi:hypothetical protein